IRTSHGTDRHGARLRPGTLPEGEGGTTGGAQLAHRARRRPELRRHAGGEDEGGAGERRPGDERRARRAAADAAVTMNDVVWRGSDPGADGAAEAAAHDLPPRYRTRGGKRLPGADPPGTGQPVARL